MNDVRLGWRAMLVGVLVCLAACAGPRPFTVPSPQLEALNEEEPYLYEDPALARERLAQTRLSGLGARIANLFTAYEQELLRAQRAQGGALNAFLSITSVLLPLSGTITPFVISNPDDAEAVSTATAGATTAVVLLNLLFKPQAKAGKSAACEVFLRDALESLDRRWDRTALASIPDTEEEWRVYLAVRGALDAGKEGAC